MYQRDARTNAIINTDDSYYKSILKIREAEKRNIQTTRQVSALEKELAELRDLVNTIVAKGA